MEAPSVQILHKIQAALSLNLPVLLGVVPAAGAGEVVGGGEAEVETSRSFVRILFVAVDPVRVVLARVHAHLTCEKKFRQVHKLCPKIQYLGRGKSYSAILLFLSIPKSPVYWTVFHPQKYFQWTTCLSFISLLAKDSTEY